jgi:cytochrome d ubiquinol oxidase subunit II
VRPATPVVAGCHGKPPKFTAQAIILAETPEDLPLDRILKVALGARKCHRRPQKELFLALPWLYLLLGVRAFLPLHISPTQAFFLLVAIIGTVGAAMFPFMLPSSSVPSHSLTVWNSSSSQHTLIWMLGFTVIFIPLIVWYTSWAFWVMRGKVSVRHVESDEHAY